MYSVINTDVFHPSKLGLRHFRRWQKDSRANFCTFATDSITCGLCHCGWFKIFFSIHCLIFHLRMSRKNLCPAQLPPYSINTLSLVPCTVWTVSSNSNSTQKKQLSKFRLYLSNQLFLTWFHLKFVNSMVPDEVNLFGREIFLQLTTFRHQRA